MIIEPYSDDPTPARLREPPAPGRRAFYLGCDPGQSIDPTAIAVVERLADPAGGKKSIFRCGHLERLPLNMAYPGIVQHVRRLLSRPPFLGRTELVLDLTGVGRPVGDMFIGDGMHPIRVTITAGDAETVDDRGIHHVAKLQLVSTVQSLLHDGRLHILDSLPEAPILKTELEDFRATVTDSGRWTFGARSGAHDDLVLALALALWRAVRRSPTLIDPGVLARSARIGRGFGDVTGGGYPGNGRNEAWPYPWRTGR